jgi:predicted RNase H-like nuclease (RuvC/YqgF family)
VSPTPLPSTIKRIVPKQHGESATERGPEPDLQSTPRTKSKAIFQSDSQNTPRRPEITELSSKVEKLEEENGLLRRELKDARSKNEQLEEEVGGMKARLQSEEETKRR